MPLEKPLVYLACPYSNKSKRVRLLRYFAVNRAAAKLLRGGYMVFSPISHSHPIAEAGELPGDFEFWKNWIIAFINVSHKMIVLMLPGWKESTGVQAEIKIALDLGIPVEYMEPVE